MAKKDEFLEIEMKFPVLDFAALKKSLRDRRARQKHRRPLHEEDHYFNAPDRDFARTDEALRLRRVGTANKLTYKGPKRDAQTKTRPEIEVDLGRGKQVAEDVERLLHRLGYRHVAVVRKGRQIYRLANEAGFAVEVCLDEVEGLGTFAE